ncbi:hypothetical protein [Segniliparus rotundus]|nr:hypothetical protein [Segniliparus rotundus]
MSKQPTTRTEPNQDPAARPNETSPERRAVEETAAALAQLGLEASPLSATRREAENGDTPTALLSTSERFPELGERSDVRRVSPEPLAVFAGFQTISASSTQPCGQLRLTIAPKCLTFNHMHVIQHSEDDDQALRERLARRPFHPWRALGAGWPEVVVDAFAELPDGVGWEREGSLIRLDRRLDGVVRRRCAAAAALASLERERCGFAAPCPAEERAAAEAEAARWLFHLADLLQAYGDAHDPTDRVELARLLDVTEEVVKARLDGLTREEGAWLHITFWSAA